MSNSHASKRRRKNSVLRQRVDTFISEAAFSGVFINLITGVLLVKFALELGATSFEIGLLAAFPFLGQAWQIPSILLAGYFNNRRWLVLAGMGLYRVATLLLGLMPWFLEKESALACLIFLAFVQSVGMGFGTGPWYGWSRDLIPKKIITRVFGQRMNLYTLYGTFAALIGAIFLDVITGYKADATLMVLSSYFVAAAVSGFVSLYKIFLLPEVPIGMVPVRNMLLEFLEPLKDKNFRRLIVFFLVLLFAFNMAVPFFPMYMLETLSLPVSYVTALWAFGQFMQVPFFKWWGWVGDKYSNITALGACLPFFIIGLMLWPVTTTINSDVTTILVLLVVIHLFLGVGIAGVLLASQVIALKLAPKHLTTSYAATLTMIGSVAAGVASIMGGWVADKLANQHVDFMISWNALGDKDIVKIYSVGGLDFLFVLAALLVLVTSPLLATVVEQGTVSREVVMRLMRLRAAGMVRSAASVSGWRQGMSFPYVLLARRRASVLPREVVEPEQAQNIINDQGQNA